MDREGPGPPGRGGTGVAGPVEIDLPPLAGPARAPARAPAGLPRVPAGQLALLTCYLAAVAHRQHADSHAGPGRADRR